MRPDLTAREFLCQVPAMIPSQQQPTKRPALPRLGVLAAVAIPKLGGSIDSSEIAAEDAVIGNLRSSLEVYAMDKVVENSERSYPTNPFSALDNELGSSWVFASDSIYHTRNDGETRIWAYDSTTGTVEEED